MTTRELFRTALSLASPKPSTSSIKFSRSNASNRRARNSAACSCAQTKKSASYAPTDVDRVSSSVAIGSPKGDDVTLQLGRQVASHAKSTATPHRDAPGRARSHRPMDGAARAGYLLIVMGERPTLGFNLLFLHPRLAGVRVYATNLVRAMLRRNRRFDVALFLPRDAAWLLHELSGDPTSLPAGVRLHRLPCEPASKRSLFLTETTRLPAAVRRAGVDLLISLDWHGPLPLALPQVVTIHDLLFRDLPEAVAPGQRWLRRALVPPMVRRATELWTISRFSAERLAAHYPAARGKLRIVGSGAPPVAQAGVARADGHLLSVGSFVAHKNHRTLIEGYLRAAPPAPLVIVGKPGPALGDPILRRLLDGAGDRVQLRHGVPDAELLELYRGAGAYLTASRYEGFGITVLEAMSQGVPVACAAAGALPEVVGDAALTFDPADPDAIAAAIRRVIGEAGLRATLIERGRARARALDWSRAAERALDAAEGLIARG